jgi:hypothetical protein
MHRTGTNSMVTNATRPYYNMMEAEQNAPTGATVIILENGPYLETGLYGVAGAGSGKRILYRSPVSTLLWATDLSGQPSLKPFVPTHRQALLFRQVPIVQKECSGSGFLRV